MKKKQLVAKIRFAMRLTCVYIAVCVIFTCSVFANSLSAQGILDKPVSLSFENVSLQKVISQIQKQTGVKFIYSPDAINASRKVSFITKDKKLVTFIEESLKPLGISYKVVDNQILLFQTSTNKLIGSVSHSEAQKAVSGIVLDETGAVLPGATVLIKGTSISTITDSNGAFSLEIADDAAVLVVNFLGYTSQEVSVNGRSSLTITLVPSASNLQEVVVNIGFGTAKKTDVAGSIASVNLEAQREAPNTNIAQFLQGSVPGLNVGVSNVSGGTPSISVRGDNTLNGNTNVLIILDGIMYPNSLSSINPDDIATIDVLKDASSAAVYGAQAANGVILITSRKGSRSGKPRISFTSSYSTQEPTVGLRPQNREQYLENIRQLHYRTAYLAPDFTTPNPAFNIVDVVDASLREGNPAALKNNNYDWWDTGTNKGKILENQLSVSGGSEKISYLLSGSYTKQQGMIINDLFKRKTIRANIEAQATNWWKLGLIANGSFVNQDGAEPSLLDLFRSSPLLVPYDDSGNLIFSPFGTLDQNPLLSYDVQDRERHNYYLATIYSEVDIPFVKGLKYRLNFGNNYRTDQTARFSKYAASMTGNAFKNYTDYYDYTLDNILSYSKTFNKHDLSGTVLYGSTKQLENSTQTNATGFSRPTLGYNDLGQATTQTTNSGGYKGTFLNQMLRIQYKYNDRYIFNGLIRRDGFSGFAANKKVAVFPSVSAAWIASEESFIKRDWLDFLKVRVGYGVVGSLTPMYSSLARIGTNASYVFGDGGTTAFGQQVNSLENPDLEWEKQAQLNIGLDFNVLGSRISGALDYYVDNTKDLLYRVTLPQVSGFGDIQTNLGQLRNKGFEASLTGVILKKKALSWSSTMVFSANSNKIVKLKGVDADGDGKEDDLIADGRFIGRPSGAIFGYQSNGIYQIGETRPAGFQEGSLRVVDVNGDNAITSADRTFQGSTAPAYRLSLLNRVEYKGFTLGVFFNSIQGGKDGYLQNNNIMSIKDDNNIRQNTFAGLDFWSPTNPDGRYQRIVQGSSPVNPLLLQDRSFIRLQDVTLSYNFAGKLLKPLKAQNINLYLSGKNLATWTKWDGWDPETGQGYDLGGRPVMKAYTIGINVTY